MPELSSKQMKRFAEAKQCLKAGGRSKPSFREICDHMREHENCCKTGSVDSDMSVKSLLSSNVARSLAQPIIGGAIGVGLASLMDRRPDSSVTPAQGEYDRIRARRRRRLYTALGALAGSTYPVWSKEIVERVARIPRPTFSSVESETAPEPIEQKQGAASTATPTYTPGESALRWLRRSAKNTVYGPKRQPTGKDMPVTPTYASGTARPTVNPNKTADADGLSLAHRIRPAAVTALRAAILGSAGAFAGGLGGSMLNKNDFEYDTNGQPKRKTRKRLGAALGGLAGLGLGLLSHKSNTQE